MRIYVPLFCLIVNVLSSSVSFIAVNDKRLAVENIKSYSVMSFRMCLKECMKVTKCKSINFNKYYLQCNMSDTSQGNSVLNNAVGYMYAYPTSDLYDCSTCKSHETCIRLSSGNLTCVGTECSSVRPTVQYASAVQSNDPPTVTFICFPGYYPLGSVSTSFCRPGTPWSSIDYRCEPPVHGGWSAWGSYGPCSLTCGGGAQYRSRSCNNPTPIYGGDWCSGSDTSSTSCNTHYCPINGEWSYWGSWSTCSEQCNGGTKSSSRSCNNPSPQHGGQGCSGSSTKSQDCNTHKCSWFIGKRRKRHTLLNKHREIQPIP